MVVESCGWCAVPLWARRQHRTAFQSWSRNRYIPQCAARYCIHAACVFVTGTETRRLRAGRRREAVGKRGVGMCGEVGGSGGLLEDSPLRFRCLNVLTLICSTTQRADNLCASPESKPAEEFRESACVCVETQTAATHNANCLVSLFPQPVLMRLFRNAVLRARWCAHAICPPSVPRAARRHTFSVRNVCVEACLSQSVRMPHSFSGQRSTPRPPPLSHHASTRARL